MKKGTQEKPESVALGGSDCWEGQDEMCPSADAITNRVKSADDSKDRSEKGSVANASALRELAGVAAQSIKVIKILENLKDRLFSTFI